MPKPMTLNVRVTGPLSDYVAAKIGDNGLYENVSEYVRELIRKDKAEEERQAFETLKAELQRSFSAPETAYKSFDPDAFLERAKRRWQA